MQALTGFKVEAAAMLLPVGISIYTAAGGLRATYIASYTHMIIMYVVIFTVVLQVCCAAKYLF